MKELTTEEMGGYQIELLKDNKYNEIQSLLKDPYDKEIPLIITTVFSDQPKGKRKSLVNYKTKLIYMRDIADTSVDLHEGKTKPADPEHYPISVHDNLIRRKNDPIMLRVYSQEVYDADESENDIIDQLNAEDDIVERIRPHNEVDMGIRTIYLTPYTIKENMTRDLYETIGSDRYKFSISMHKMKKKSYRFIMPQGFTKTCSLCSFCSDKELLTGESLGIKIKRENFAGDLFMFSCDYDICPGAREELGDNIIKIKHQDPKKK